MAHQSMMWTGRSERRDIERIYHFRCKGCGATFATLLEAKQHVNRHSRDDRHAYDELCRVATAVEPAPCSFALMDAMIGAYVHADDDGMTLLDCENVYLRPLLPGDLPDDPFWGTVLAEIDRDPDDPDALKKAFLMKNLLFDCDGIADDEAYMHSFHAGLTDVQHALLIQPVQQPGNPRPRGRRRVVVAPALPPMQHLNVKRPLVF